MNLKFLIMVVALCVVACSSGKRKGLSELEIANLAKTFDIKDEEFERFKAVPVAPIERTENVPLPVSDKYGKQVVSSERPKIATSKKGNNKSSIKSKQKQAVAEVKDISASSAEKIEAPTTAEKQAELLLHKYDVRSQPIWEQFNRKFVPGESLNFKISYLGISVGNILMQVMPDVDIGQRRAYHFRAQLKSSTYYEMLYSLDDVVDTYVDVEKFLPIKFSLVQRESGKNVDDLQVFDHAVGKTFHWYKKEKKGQISKYEKQGAVPVFFQDSFSAIWFMRGLPLKKGDVYEFPVITRAKIYISNVKVVGFEKIEIGNKSYHAIRLRATNHFPGIEGKKDDIQFWFSADKDRKLLKFDTKIKIGTVEGILIET